MEYSPFIVNTATFHSKCCQRYLIKTRNVDSFSSHFIMYGHEWRERASNAAVYRVQILFFFLKKKKTNLKKEKIALSFTIPLEMKPSKINNNNNNNHSSSQQKSLTTESRG